MDPPDASIADWVDAVVAGFEEIGAMRTVARFDRANEIIDGLQAEVEALDYPPLRTESLYYRLALAGDAGQVDEAVRLAYDVVEAAAASRDRRMAANAWISLAILVGITRHDFGQIERSARRVGGGDRLWRPDLPGARLLASLSSITARVGTTRPGKRSKPCFRLYERVYGD